MGNLNFIHMTNSSTGDIDILKETTEEKDLGVWMNNSLKPSNHTRAVNKANQLLGLVTRSFTYGEWGTHETVVHISN